MLHGGGFVAGSLESHDYLARRTAHETGALVVSVDYRLAPEHPFPAGQVDVVTVLDLLASNAELNEAKVSQKQAKQTTNNKERNATPLAHPWLEVEVCCCGMREKVSFHFIFKLLANATHCQHMPWLFACLPVCVLFACLGAAKEKRQRDDSSSQSVDDLLAGAAPRSILVMGDSAGGNLVSTSLLRAHLQGFSHIHKHVVGQLLIYPTTHASCHECHRSFYRYGSGYYLEAVNMAWFSFMYLGDLRTRSTLESVSIDESSLVVTHPAHPLVSPLEGSLELLSTLPPAVAVFAECDPLVGEGIAFVDRMKEAGVPVRSHVFPRTIHGFLSVPMDEHEAAVSYLFHGAHSLWQGQ